MQQNSPSVFRNNTQADNTKFNSDHFILSNGRTERKTLKNSKSNNRNDFPIRMVTITLKKLVSTKYFISKWTRKFAPKCNHICFSHVHVKT